MKRSPNIIVIFVAMVVGSVFLKDRLSSVARAEADAVKIGHKLPDLVGWNWGAQDQTLVLALRKGCHICEDSVPFYQRLIAQHQEKNSNTTIVAAFPDSADAVKEVVQSEGWRIRTLASVPLETLKASGTPTLLLVDKAGTIQNLDRHALSQAGA